MYYFAFDTKDGTAYEAVENAAQAAKYIAAGWRPVSCNAFIAAWKLRDARAGKEAQADAQS